MHSLQSICVSYITSIIDQATKWWIHTQISVCKPSPAPSKKKTPNMPDDELSICDETSSDTSIHSDDFMMETEDEDNQPTQPTSEPKGRPRPAQLLTPPHNHQHCPSAMSQALLSKALVTSLTTNPNGATNFVSHTT